MKVLFIAPIPPPTHGQSLAAEVLLKRVREDVEVSVVDQSKKKRTNSLWHTLQRAFTVFSFFVQTAYKQRNANVIYFSLSESIGGNIKDLIIYCLCYGKLNRTVIHMLGGAGMRTIFDKKGILFKLNRHFISRVKAVIVEGQAQADTFLRVLPASKVHIVPNFAEDFLFVPEDRVRRKFDQKQPLKILYLSNLIYGKGFEELADAYLLLDEKTKSKVKLVFVGGFQSEDHQNEFFQKIKPYSGISYYGKFVRGEEKKDLYLDSHVFCLPTYYPYEGQPISILESYATGCFVITTYHSGIPEVFADGVNGYVVEKKSPESIKKAIEKIINNEDVLEAIAVNNRNTAYARYRTSTYASAVFSILGLDEFTIAEKTTAVGAHKFNNRNT